MSTNNTELITSLEGEITDLHNAVAQRLDDLKRDVMEVAAHGANLGDHLDTWARTLKLSPVEVANRLATLGLRADVTLFAKRAAHARRRGLLDDPAQLQFALADADEADRASKAPVWHGNTEVMRLMSQTTRLRQLVNGWLEREPVERWDATVRRSVREQLEPLAKLYNALNGF